MPPGDLGTRPTPPPTPTSANCLAGTYFDGSTCKACTEGQFQPLTGQYGCQFCPPNTVATPDATSCVSCPEGCSCSGKGPAVPLSAPTCFVSLGQYVHTPSSLLSSPAASTA